MDHDSLDWAEQEAARRRQPLLDAISAVWFGFNALAARDLQMSMTSPVFIHHLAREALGGELPLGISARLN